MNMRCRTNFIVPFVGLLVLNLPSAHSQVSLQSPPDAVNFDANYMSTQLVHQVDPDFAWTPHTPSEVAPICPFNVVLGVDGTVLSVDPPQPYGSLCAEPYFSSAKRAVRLWTWKPQFKDGVPVRVSTSVTVRFDAASTSPVSILDSTRQTAVSIELKSGSTIHADTVNQEGVNVSYTIGEDRYKIPADMVEKILREEPPASAVAPRPNAAAGWGTQPGFESLAELRHACATDSTHFAAQYPQFAKFGGACAALEIDMGPSYEADADEAVHMAQTLCAKYEGPVQYLPRPKDASLADAWQVFQDRFAKLQRAQSDAQQKLSSLGPLSTDQYFDLNNERLKLINRLDMDNPALNASPNGHLDPQQKAAIQDRLDAVEKMLDPNQPEIQNNPKFQAAQLRLQRTEIDLARATVVCQDRTAPQK